MESDDGSLTGWSVPDGIKLPVYDDTDVGGDDVLAQPEPNRVRVDMIRSKIRSEVEAKVSRARNNCGSWSLHESNQFIETATRIVGGELGPDNRTIELLSECPVELCATVSQLRMIGSTTFGAFISNMAGKADVEGYLLDDLNFGGVFGYKSPDEMLALRYVVGMQGDGFKAKMDSSIRASRYFREGYNSQVLSMLMLYDSSLAMDYFQSSGGTVDWDIRPQVTAAIIDGDSVVRGRVGDEELEFADMFSGGSRLSVDNFLYLSRMLGSGRVEIPLAGDLRRRLELTLDDDRTLGELAKSNSPYVNYLGDILFLDDGEERLERLRSVVATSEINFLMAMEARALTQVDLVSRIEDVLESAGILNFGNVDGSRIIDRLHAVYLKSGRHVGMSEAVKVIVNPDDIDHRFYLRGNGYGAFKSILRHGCYAQEVIPYIPPTPNNLPGFLNGVGYRGRVAGALEVGKSNETLKHYREESGELSVTLIFVPSDETETQTILARGRIGKDKMEQTLSFVGVPSTELGAVILGSGIDEAEVVEMMVQCEKFVAVYKQDGDLLIDFNSWSEAVANKEYRGISDFLSRPPVEQLKRYGSGHGFDSLYDHTMRVRYKVDKYLPEDIDGHAADLIRVAAILHDARKYEDGNQAETNVMGAVQVLDTISGLSLQDKEKVRLAIFVDDTIGADILANFDDESASDAEVDRIRERISSMFSDQESMQVALCLYVADVAGIGDDEKMMATFRVKEKLSRLGLWFFG